MSFDPEAFKAAEIRVAAFNELTPEQGRALYCGYLKEKLIADGLGKQLIEQSDLIRKLESALRTALDRWLYHLALRDEAAFNECKSVLDSCSARQIVSAKAEESGSPGVPSGVGEPGSGVAASALPPAQTTAQEREPCGCDGIRNKHYIGDPTCRYALKTTQDKPEPWACSECESEESSNVCDRHLDRLESCPKCTSQDKTDG